MDRDGEVLRGGPRRVCSASGGDKTRASRTVNQSGEAFFGITVNTFVGRFSTDSVLAAEFRNREYLS